MTSLVSKKLKAGAACLLAVCMLLSFTACRQEEPEPEPEEPAPVEEPAEPVEEPEEELIQAPALQEDLRAAFTNNDDTVGWLFVPNTTINNSVLQGPDNEYYLRLDENQQYSFLGCYFADYENTFGSRDALSRNTVIYGHNINYADPPDGERFSQLFKFVDIECAKNNPYIFFSTLEEDMVFQIFAVAYVPTTLKYIEVGKLTDLDYANMLNDLQLRSEYTYPDVEVTPDDKIVVLSTCSYILGQTREDVRLLVVGKLMPAGAELPATANVVENVNKLQIA